MLHLVGNSFILNYYYSLCNSSEDRSSYPVRGESLTPTCVCCGLRLKRHISTYAITRLSERSSHRLSAIQQLCLDQCWARSICAQCSQRMKSLRGSCSYHQTVMERKTVSRQCTDFCVLEQASLIISADEVPYYIRRRIGPDV
jgi:hypothetical protein